MEMTSCVASDLDDFVAIAVRLATEADARNAAVAAIEESRGAIFDDDHIVAELEDWFLAAVEEARAVMP
jgi:predicted O-linked N-acetylglucosamine transferase (SPINDLY family)